MAVAQIPDLKTWEISAQVGEQDRGRLTVGQRPRSRWWRFPEKVPRGCEEHGRHDRAAVGPALRVHAALLDPGPELRPGMSARIVVTER